MFDIENKLDNLSGIVLSEGRYILINEKSFEFLTNGGASATGKRVQLYQMMKRALPNDPLLIVTAYKSVFVAPPFNLHTPDVPEGCVPIPVWHTQANFLSLLNVKAFQRVMNHYEKKVVAFGTSLRSPLLRGVDFRDQLLKFMADVDSGITPLEVVLSPRTPGIHRQYFACLPRAIIAANDASIPRDAPRSSPTAAPATPVASHPPPPVASAFQAAPGFFPGAPSAHSSPNVFYQFGGSAPPPSPFFPLPFYPGFPAQ